MANGPWYPSCLLNSSEEDYSDIPNKPGVYIISNRKIIGRVGGDDRKGIVYIGKSKNLRQRVKSFWNGNHTAGGYLHEHPVIAGKIMKMKIISGNDVDKGIGKLKIRYATITNLEELELAERAVMFPYIRRFGEPPPLNLNMPRRWDRMPSLRHLRWAEKGIFGV
jgi:hypothetical protein